MQCTCSVLAVWAACRVCLQCALPGTAGTLQFDLGRFCRNFEMSLGLSVISSKLWGINHTKVAYINHTKVVKKMPKIYVSCPLTVLESPGKPATGSPSFLKGYHNALIDGSPSITVSPV